jgi:hypothetical protein
MSITGGNFSAEDATISEDILVNGANVGRGGGNLSSNTSFGAAALGNNTTGNNNTSLGSETLYTNTSGSQNTATGVFALFLNTIGNSNTAVGLQSSYNNTTGNVNVAVGLNSLFGNTTGTSNVALGHGAGHYITNDAAENSISNNSVFVGSQTKAQADNQTNQIVIGHLTTGNGSNTVTIGNDSITSNFLNRKINLKGANSAISSIEYANPAGTLHWTLQTNFGSSGEQQPFSIRNAVLGQDAILIQHASNNVTINGAIATITGNLSGTGASFSSDVQTSTRFIAANPAGEIRITPNLSGTTNRIESFGSLPFSLTSIGAITLAAGGTTPQITLATGGAVTLTGALNGTSASFTGNVTSTGGNFRLFNGYYLTAKRADGADINVLGFPAGSNNLTSVTPGDYNLQNTGGTNLFSVSSAGAATFSSSVSSTEFRLNNVSTLQHVNVYTVLKDLVGRNTILLGDTNDPTNYYDNTTHIFRSRTSVPRLLIDSSGSVGIGTDSPSSTLEVRGTFRNALASGVGGQTLLSPIIGVSNGYLIGVDTSNNITHTWHTGANLVSMAITSAGAVVVGNTSAVSSASNTIACATFNKAYNWLAVTDSNYIQRSNDSQGAFFNFLKGASDVGSITVLGSTTFYNSTSDYRLKEDLKDYNGLELLSKIKTYDYEWKSDQTRSYGVLAHELAEVLPYAVNGEKDEVKEDGTEKMQGVDYSKIVPVLIKAIQELKSEIDSLKNQIK